MPIRRHLDNLHKAQHNHYHHSPSPIPSPTPPPLPPRDPHLHSHPPHNNYNHYKPNSPPSYTRSYGHAHGYPHATTYHHPYTYAPPRPHNMSNEAQGFLLLTIPEATIGQVFEGQKMDLGAGELAVEIVALPIPPEIGHQTANPFELSPNDPPPTHDMWLILRVGENFEHTLVPGNAMEARAPPGGDGGPTYVLREPAVPGAELVLTLSAPRSVAEFEDLGTLEALFRQYGVLPRGSGLDGVQAPSIGAVPVSYGGDSKSGFGAAGAGAIAGASGSQHSGMPPAYQQGSSTQAYNDDKTGAHGTQGAYGAAGAPPDSPVIHGGAAEDLRGRLVLVDETTGAVIGELDNAPKLGAAEEAEITKMDHTKPVMLDFGPIVANTREVRVTRVPADELDGWMLKGADIISRGVLGVSGAASGAMLRSAERYRSKAVPRPAPVRMGAVTNSLKSVHGATAAGARVTGRTTAMINDTVERFVSKKKKGGEVYAAPQPGAAGPAGTVPKQSTFGKLKEAAAPAAVQAMGWAKTKAHEYRQPGAAGTGAGAHGAAPGAAAYGAQGGVPAYGAQSGAAGPPPLPPRLDEKSGVSPGLDAGQGQYGAQGGFGADQGQAYGAQGGLGVPTSGTASSGYHDEKHGGLAPPVSPGHSNPASGATTPRKGKRPLLNRTLLAADVVLSSLEAAANDLVTSGTTAASTAVGARYGQDAGAAVAYSGASVRNAVLVYVDVRGVGRRSILKATAKGYVKARLKNGETVNLAPVASGDAQPTFQDDQGHLVVGVPTAPQKH